MAANMASVESHIIPKEGFLNFRFYHFVRKYGKDVMFQIFSCCFLESSIKTLREILVDNGLINPQRSAFSPQEIDNITNKPPESLDITALNKILQALWLKGVNDPGIKIKDLMKKIKDERNNVSHEEDNISESEVDSKLKEFGKLLEDAIDEAVLLFPCHAIKYNQLKSEIRKFIPKVQEKIREKYDPTCSDDIKKFQSEIDEFGHLLTEYIIEKSSEHLKQSYLDLCKVQPFNWLCDYGFMNPCEVTVSLKIDTEEEFQGIRRRQKSIIFDQNEILSKKDINGKDVNVVILSGDAGCGKTTILCWHLEKWYKADTQDISNLSSYQILLYMEFRKFDYDNFDDYLSDIFRPLVNDFGLRRVRSVILQSKCLILFDGFDEKNEKSSKLFDETLTLGFNEMKMIVTTRPMNTKSLTHLLNKSKKQRLNLNILGLTNNMRMLLIDRFTEIFIKDVTKRDEMKKEISQALKSHAPEMRQILRNPLQLNLFILLYVEYPAIRDTLSTVTKLLMELQNHRSKQLLKKLGIESDSDQNLNQSSTFQNKYFGGVIKSLHTIFKTSFNISMSVEQYIQSSSLQLENNEFYHYFTSSLSEMLEMRSRPSKKSVHEFERFYKLLSLKYYLEGKYEMKDEDVMILREKCAQLNLDFEVIASTYFNIKHARKGLDIEKIYNYRHRIEQEFAAGSTVCDAILECYRENNTIFLQSLERKESIINNVVETLRNSLDKLESSMIKNANLLPKDAVRFVEGKTRQPESSINNKQPELPVHPWEGRLYGIKRFVIGVLYNTDIDLLHKIINNLLQHHENRDMNKFLENRIDDMLSYVVETSNDNKVLGYVAQEIENTFGKEELRVSSYKNLSCLPPLLSMIKPKKLLLKFSRDNPDDQTHLISTIESAVHYGVELNIMLNHHRYSEEDNYSDEYLNAAKTCTHFLGKLGAVGATLIPSCMKELDISMNFNDLNSLSQNISSLKQLKNLVLELNDDGSFGPPDSLIEIPYLGMFFTLYFYTDLDSHVDLNVLRTAEILNALWPKKRKPYNGTVLSLNTTSPYTEDAVSLLLNSLVIGPVIVTRIKKVTENALQKEEELKILSESRGFGNLVMDDGVEAQQRMENIGKLYKKYLEKGFM